MTATVIATSAIPAKVAIWPKNSVWVTAPGVAQCLLHHVVEGAEPVVDHHVDLDLEPGGEDDHRGGHHRPPEPAMRREVAPEDDEDRAADEHVFVEPEVGGEALRALEYRRRGLVGAFRNRRRVADTEYAAETERRPEIPGDEVPEEDRRQRPGDGGQEEQLRSREEGREHGHPRSRLATPRRPVGPGRDAKPPRWAKR